MHEYSYNLGAIRRGLGIESNRYGPAAFNMFHRYGFSDAVTLGLRAEGAKNYLNAGPMATFVLGGSGVLSVAAAGSEVGDQTGTAGSLSYTFQSNAWSAGLSVRREWGRFATLGDPPIVSNRKVDASVSASYNMNTRGTVSLGHSWLSTRSGMIVSTPTPARPNIVALLEDQRRTTLSYNVPLVSGWASLNTSLSHIKEKTAGSSNEVFVGVSVFFEKDYFAAASYRNDGNRNSQFVELTKRQPIGEGLGFTMFADRDSDSTGHNQRFKSSIQYNAPAAILRADIGRNRDLQGRTFDDNRASIAGGIAVYRRDSFIRAAHHGQFWHRQGGRSARCGRSCQRSASGRDRRAGQGLPACIERVLRKPCEPCRRNHTDRLLDRAVERNVSPSTEAAR